MFQLKLRRELLWQNWNELNNFALSHFRHQCNNLQGYYWTLYNCFVVEINWYEYWYNYTLWYNFIVGRQGRSSVACVLYGYIRHNIRHFITMLGSALWAIANSAFLSKSERAKRRNEKRHNRRHTNCDAGRYYHILLVIYNYKLRVKCNNTQLENIFSDWLKIAFF